MNFYDRMAVMRLYLKLIKVKKRPARGTILVQPQKPLKRSPRSGSDFLTRQAAKGLP